jgi:hypothetical protein
MMQRSFVVGVFVALLLVSPVAAQEVGDTQAFAVVARLAGVPPSQWVTDLVVHNLMDYDVVVGFLFFPEGESHGLSDFLFDVQRTFGPRETQLFEDVLSSLFGYTEDIKGTLIVSCAGDLMLPNPDGAEIISTTRTYDVSSPQGTYGQTVPSAGEMVNYTGLFSYVTGARNDADFRSNLGIVNISLVEVTVHYRIRKAEGTVIAQGSKTMGSLSMGQWSFKKLGVAGTVEGALTVELWFDPSSVPLDPCADFANAFGAYVSKVDQRTQDGEFMFAVPEELPFCPDD